MTSLKDAIERAMDELDSHPHTAMRTEAITNPIFQEKETTPNISQPSISNTEYMFNMIRAHGSMTGVEARDELEARGIKWAKDSSAYLGQLARLGLMSSAKGHTSAGYATNRYACLYPEYHRSVRSTKKRKAKPAPKVAPEQKQRGIIEAPAADNKTEAQRLVNGMNLGLAKEVYLELHHVFSLGA